MTTCGEVLPALLRSYGIEVVFGIPGVHTVELYRGLPDSGLRHYTPRHEQGAGFMADGYARAGGGVAACFLITGPGLTNATTAMAQAYGDSVPMLVITAVNATHHLPRHEGRLHELRDQRALAAGVAAFSETVASPAQLEGALARAFAVFDSERPRPVHLELPIDVITAEAAPLTQTGGRRRTRPVPHPSEVERASDLLRGASTPFVVLGGGTTIGGAETALRFVERLGAPTVLTTNAKGLLPPGHPLSLASLLPCPPVLDALRNADVVLAVGTELSDTETLLMNEELSLSGSLIRVDLDARQLVQSPRPADLGLRADAGATLVALHDALEGHVPDTATAHARVRTLRAESWAGLRSDYKAHTRFVKCILDTLPDVVIVGDSTQPVYGGSMFCEMNAPRSWFDSSRGYGTLGFALPAALGAKLAVGDRPVVALIGDGGLQFTIAELASAVELGLPVAVIVWNSRGYKEIRDNMVARGLPEIGVKIHTPDFQILARGFGCAAEKIESLSALPEALRRAMRTQGPTLLEVDDDAAQSWV